MLIRIPWSTRQPVKAWPVNWLPWSVLKISGHPRESAASSTDTHHASSSVFDSAHDSTYRLYQSSTAAKYRNPPGIPTYVMSVDHTWLGRSTVRSRSKYG